MDFKTHFKGIDSLYLSYKGHLRKEVKELLEEKKKLAQSDRESEQARATIRIGDHSFEVLGMGEKCYAFIIVDNWYNIKISRSNKNIMPQLCVQISSEVLTCYGVGNTVNDLRRIVIKILGDVKEEIISRVDIFVDFSTSEILEDIKRPSLITKARKVQKYWEYDIFSGWTIGMGGDILARIYEKTLELKQSHKDYMKEIWEKYGWNTHDSIWRIEYQLRRNFLKQIKTNTIPDIPGNINSIWKYCLHDWLRYAVINPNINKTRWKTHPLWEILQKTEFTDIHRTDVIRTVDKERIPSKKSLFQNGIGYLTSFAAINGYDEVNSETIHNYLSEAKNYLREEKYGNDEEYLKTKILLKKKRYNKVKEN